MSGMPERDAEVHLIEPGDWNDDVAWELAQNENIQLNDDHWNVIRFMHNDYEKLQVATDGRLVIKHLAKRIPYGYVKQACKIAGMKRPRAWSTG